MKLVVEVELGLQPRCRILGAQVMHKSEVLHGELLGSERHIGWVPHRGRLLRQWHTLVGPRCHLVLQAGVLGLLLLVDLGLVSLYAAYISVKKG